MKEIVEKSCGSGSDEQLRLHKAAFPGKYLRVENALYELPSLINWLKGAASIWCQADFSAFSVRSI